MSKSIFKNSIYKMILNVFNLLVPLLVNPYIVSLLDRELFDVYNQAAAKLVFFMAFAIFGVYYYGVREISKVRDDKQKLESLFTNLFFFSIITSVITSAVYAGYVLLFVDGAKAQAIYLVLVIQILGNMISIEWINEAVENYSFITKKTIIVRLLYILSIFIFIKKPEDIIPYALIMSLAAIVNNGISYIYIRRKLKFNFTDFHLTKYIKPLLILLLINNVTILYTQLDKLFLAQFGSEIATTEYTQPSSVITSISVMLVSLLLVAVPRLSYYVSHKLEKDYAALLIKSTRAFFLILCPVCIGLYCLSYEAMYLYTNGVLAYSYHVLEIFALRFLISCLYQIFTNQILYLRNQEKAMVKILLVGGILNLIFNSLLVVFNILTPVAAILTTTIAETIMLGIMYWFIRVKIKVDFKVFQFSNMKYLYFSLPFIPITWFIKSFSLTVVPTCLIVMPVCGIFYFLVLLITKDDMLQYFIAKLSGAFKRK